MKHSFTRVIAVSFLLSVIYPHPICAGKLKFKTISQEDSLLTVKVGDLKTKYYGTGWNESYTLQFFKAIIRGSIVKRSKFTPAFSLVAEMTELAKGYYWQSKTRNLLQLVESKSMYRNRGLKVLDQYNLDIKNSRDSKHKSGQSLKFSLNKRGNRGREICYAFSYVGGFGNSWDGCSDWCPALTLRVCAVKDLDLEMTKPPKYFRIDTQNEKAYVNLAHVNLGEKLRTLIDLGRSKKSSARPGWMGSKGSTNSYTNPDLNPTGKQSAFGSAYKSAGPDDGEVCKRALADGSPPSWKKTEKARDFISLAKQRGFKPGDCLHIVRAEDSSFAKNPKNTKVINKFLRALSTDKPLINIEKKLSVLKKLLDKGLITRQEAAEKRQKILKDM